MSLESGLYVVKSVAGDRFVGRFPIEDRSLRPKQVFALPEGVEIPRLVVEKNDKGYRIKAHGAPTGVYNDAVFAFLLDIEQPEDWIITAQPQHGNNVFTVETHDRGKGWVRAQEEGHRGFEINIRPLIVGPSLPPRFPTSELFTFTRLDRD